MLAVVLIQKHRITTKMRLTRTILAYTQVVQMLWHVTTIRMLTQMTTLVIMQPMDTTVMEYA